MLAPGTKIDRYELVAPIGEGGTAQVWLARARGKHGFEKLFALKAIHGRYADDPGFRAMLLDEARIIALIEHPNVAQVFDLGDGHGGLFLVMEYVDGDSLAGLLITAGVREGHGSSTVPLAPALRIAADVCSGLHAAHRLADARGVPLGVVHRDVSPQNVLVSVRGDVKIIDFGIAHARDRIGAATPEGAIKGKVHYMAPEQVRHAPLGAFTDVFAAGAVLYRMLGGRAPFASGSDAATIHLLLGAGSPPELPSEVPAGVRAICARALAPVPSDRFTSALAMKDALEAALAERGVSIADAASLVATWAQANLSERARERREHLETRTLVSAGAPTANFTAELAPKTIEVPPKMASDNDPPASSPSPRNAAPARPAGPPAPHFSPAPIGSALPDEPAPAPPGFMDVRALVDRARSGSSSELPAPSPPPNEGGARGPAAPAAPEPGANDVAAQKAPTTPSSPTPPGKLAGKAVPAPDPTARLVKMAFGVIGVVVLLAIVLLAMPRLVRTRIIARANDLGVQLLVDDVGVGFGGVTLRGVTARATAVPGVVAYASEIVSLGPLAAEIRVHGGELTIDGNADAASALATFYEKNRAVLAGTPTSPRHIVIVGGRATWNGAFGAGSQIRAGEIGVDVDSRGPDAEDARGTIGRFDVTTKRTVFGPWSGSFEHVANTSRARLQFDPPVPDGPSALVVWGVNRAPQVTINVPRSPLANLGVRPADLGLPADPSTELALRFESTLTPQGRTEAKGRIELFRARFSAISKTPIDIRIDGQAQGPLDKPLELDQTTVNFGPFLANVSGTITPHAAGFRLDAGFRTQPIPCADFARAEAKKMGTLAAIVQELAQNTGAARVTGNALATGVLRYDTKAPDEATFTYSTKETCGLSLFGAK